MNATLVSTWTAARRALENAGVDSPVMDARLLVEAGAKVQRIDILTDPHRLLHEAQIKAIDVLLQRRIAREPISHILGRKAFWTFDIAVTPDVLTPRPETEILVDVTLEVLALDQPARILDLGVGSGAILCAALAERPLAHGVGIDASSEALAVAQGNAAALGLETRLELHHGDWGRGLPGGYDLVLSNPPYIPSADIEGLEPEVAKFEPRLALDGGPDGLDAYRVIVADLPRLLRAGGAYALEVGIGQAEAVADLARAAGLTVEQVRADPAGTPRVVWGRRA